MDKFKNLSDAELIKVLREYGINHGPILDSTRTVYEKKLVEFERKKKIYPSSEAHTLEISPRSVKDNYSGELPAQKSEQQNSAGTATHFSQPNLSQPCFESPQAEKPFGTGENPAYVNQEQKRGASDTRQEKRTSQTRQKKGAREARPGTRETRQTKGIIETRQEVRADNPVSELSASATTMEEPQKAEVKVASPAAPTARQTKRSKPLIQKDPQPEPTSALKFDTETEAEQKHGYHLAMALVPLLNKVPAEKMVTLHHELLNLISSHCADSPRKHPQARP
uniref:Emerin n=1 Tax=Aquarana catesbeiana TaxID=8400 RepID=C1C3V4_AQUCT|nr:Emerin [Aquarana catesbeiana]